MPPSKKTRAKVEKGYGSYLHKVHKSIHGKDKGITISGTAMEVINMLIEDLENRVANKAFELAKFEKKSTLSAKHIQTAAKLVFPPEMGGMAMQEGTKALTKYTSA